MTLSWTPGTDDPALSALARTTRLLVALDFDGTASPLVDHPMSARALPEVAAAVSRLAALPGTVVAYVSGRSMPDLRIIAEHDDSSRIALSGSHGAQYWLPGEGEQDTASIDPVEHAEIAAEVAALIEGIPGVAYEPKSLGFGIHTRTASPQDEQRAFGVVDEYAARRIPGWRRRQGHSILEYSVSSTGKDVAIRTLRTRFDATAVLFAGDDVTDEDAIRVLEPQDLGVRVGDGDTAAMLRVENPQQIAALLGRLADERASKRE